MQLKEQDWEEWFHHPCTQKFLQDMKDNRQGALEYIAGGGTCDTGSVDTTAQATIREVSLVRALQMVVDLIEGCKPEEKKDDAIE